jgi:hypothetical protein
MAHKKWIALGATLVAVAGIAACSDDLTSGGNARMIVRLTDAPLTDSVEAVNIFVVRVQARAAKADSAASDSVVSSTEASEKGGWVTVAEPNKVIDILKLQNDTTTIGDASVPKGDYRALRFVIDPSKSSVTLKGGQELTGSSSPGIKFPSAAQSGIKVFIQAPDSTVSVDSTTTVVVDFDLENSFVMRGSTVRSGGLTFKPVIRAEVPKK